MRLPILVLSAVMLLSPSMFAQQITIKADDYQHQFEGGGVSIGLYMGHHYSMPATGQDQAIRLVNKDLNMRYLQDYINIYPADDPAYFDRRANYIKAAQQYNPEIQVSMVGNKFPADLLHDIQVNGKTYGVLNTDDPEIYDKLANWWFLLFQGFHERGVNVEILNTVNEPDLGNCGANQCRKYHYGLNGDTKRAVAIIFEDAVAKFEAMFDNPAINTTDMKVPLIMGPSTISPNGCLEYVRYFKENYPAAWDNIDIVATHQYINGHRGDVISEIISEIEGKPLHQSETHASRKPNQADDLGSIAVAEDHRTALSLSRIFGAAVTNGVNAWYYFENNYPNDFHPGGLLQVAWAAAAPVPYKHYYAYKQLTSAQPAFSNVVTHELTDVTKAEITTFRNKDEDTVYLHLSNYFSVNKSFNIRIEGSSGLYGINSLNVRTTDGAKNDQIITDTTYTGQFEELSFTAGPYSVNTLKIGISNVITSVNDPDTYENVRMYFRNGTLEIFGNKFDELEEVIGYSVTGQILFHRKDLRGLYTHIGNMNDNNKVVLVKVRTKNYLHTRKILMVNQ